MQFIGYGLPKLGIKRFEHLSIDGFRFFLFDRGTDADVPNKGGGE